MANLNYELPSDFPEEQLVQITQSLAQLPSGTAEGCYPALVYARNRLPAIRREHVISEELDIPEIDSDAAPPVVRGAFVDDRLRHLIASVTTALDEYRRLAGEEPPDDVPEVGVAASGDILEGATAQSQKIEKGLDEVAGELAATANPDSRSADRLKRQISDGQGLNRLARAELWMPRIVASWYRSIVNALKEYPSLIKNTADDLKVGADIAEIAADRWHDFQKNRTTFWLEEFRKACDSLSNAADKLEERRRRKATISGAPADEFNSEVARAMILVGRVPPAHWIPSITRLEFGTRRLRNLEPLAVLDNLRSLTHVAARVSNLEPLANLIGLERLDLNGTRVSHLDPLANLIALERLDLYGTRVSNLRPLGRLLNLKYLNVGWTLVRDLGPLAVLHGLKTLLVATNNIKDVAPLSALSNLEYLDLGATLVDDVSPLAALTSLRTLNLAGTAVTDVSPLSNLTTLRRLSITNTKVTNVSSLQHLHSLSINGQPITGGPAA